MEYIVVILIMTLLLVVAIKKTSCPRPKLQLVTAIEGR